MAGAVSRRGGSHRPGVTGYGDLGTSLLFIVPLFIGYEIGVAFIPAGNGVDFVTRWVFAAVGHDRRNYLMLNVGMAAMFAAIVMLLRRHHALELRRFIPMVTLSAIYALTLGTLIVFVMQKLLGFDGLMAVGGTGGAAAFVVSLGAGVHEEMFFRLGLFSGGAYVVRACGLRHRWAVAVALVLSSLAFSAAHHLGAQGDPWDVSVFTYRALAGCVFGMIFYFHSLAHAVYTHFFYDMYVLVFHAGG